MKDKYIKLIVDEENIDERIDIFIRDNYDESRNKIQEQIKEHNILLNDEKVKTNYRLKEGDIISFDPKIFELEEIKSEDIDLEVLYEDEYLSVVFKDKGILTHPTNKIRKNTLVNGLLYNYTRDNLSDLNGQDRPGIVHRLDKDTSGLLLIAKDNETHKKLSDQFRNREVDKYYLAICYGKFEETNGLIESYISRDLNNRKRMRSGIEGRYSKTLYKSLQYIDGYSLVLVKIITGRTHQIRVSMKDLNHPIVGDMLYYNRKSEFNIDSQLLNSYSIGFIHPYKEKYMRFHRKPDDEFLRVGNIIGFNFNNIDEEINKFEEEI